MQRLIEKMARAEREMVNTQFLAPRIRTSDVVVRIRGLTKTFQPTPSNFEGWGIFRITTDETAELSQQADRVQVGKYLKGLKTARFYLVRQLRDGTWLATPVNGSTFENSFGAVRPVPIHLVTMGRAFEQVVGRWDGRNFWFDKADRRGDPKLPRSLAAALKNFVNPDALQIKGLTPELREAYRLVFEKDDRLRVRCSEARLKQALALGGGQLESFIDGGDYWNTRWVTSDGEQHISAIRKSDLTVLSAGICLDGEDQKFDLPSLVGVVEQRD